nr:paxillin-like [Leptinotarsa decemlineata]
MDDHLDALLADLQNTVSGSTGVGSNYSGYGQRVTRQSPSEIESHVLKSDSYGVKSGSYGKNQPPTSDMRSPGYGIRGSHSSEPSTMEKQRAFNNNLDELDSLLLDLSSKYGTSTPDNMNGSGGNYNGSLHESGGRSPANYSRPSSAQSTLNRPSVDSLLDELNSGHNLALFISQVNQGLQHQTVSDSQYALPIKAIQSQSAPPAKQNLDSMLGNLQADMSRQGVNTSQKGCCNACDKPIVGQVITALGKTWHPEHFTCAHCTQELGTRNFFEREGKPFCEPDYHNLFSPRCAYCNGPILDKCVTALEKTWHTDHFFCAQCGKQFGEDGFHEREGKPYCRDDYFDMFAPKCGACNRAIMENYISALNSQWHPDCFVCRVSMIYV